MWVRTFLVDLELAIQLLSFFGGKIIYQEQPKKEIFEEATNSLEEKETSLDLDRHHFQNIEFTSSLTRKKYKGGPKPGIGTLLIIDLETNTEVPNRSIPTKKDIIGQAIIDLGGKLKLNTKSDTTYGRYHLLTTLKNNLN